MGRSRSHELEIRMGATGMSGKSLVKKLRAQMVEKRAKNLRHPDSL